MATQTSEQALRYEAVLRRALGHRVCAICRDLQRSPRWLNKGWREFKAHPETNFAEQARAPHTSPHKTAEEVEQAIIAIRRVLEAGATPETRYGLIGAWSIQGKRERLGIKHPPSEATIQRVLAKHPLTHPLGANHESAYYPWPAAWEMNAIFATDIITKHVSDLVSQSPTNRCGARAVGARSVRLQADWGRNGGRSLTFTKNMSYSKV
jgi:hypothetical protein